MRDKIKEAQEAYEAAKLAEIKVIKAKWIAPNGQMMQLSNLDELIDDAERKRIRALELVYALEE